jgi:Ca2+/Na+ antiporter
MGIINKKNKKMLKKIFTSKYAYLLFGIGYFLIFAYDIENDRDFWTWLWLLNSQLNLLIYFRESIKEDRKENMGNITNSTVFINER